MSTPLGPRLRTFRRERGISQAALAARLGISPSYLNLIESGKRALTADLLLAAARELDVDLRALGGEGDTRLAHDLLEVFGDPALDGVTFTTNEVREMAAREPLMARAMVQLHRTLRQARETEPPAASWRRTRSPASSTTRCSPPPPRAPSPARRSARTSPPPS